MEEISREHTVVCGMVITNTSYMGFNEKEQVRKKKNIKCTVWRKKEHKED